MRATSPLEARARHANLLSPCARPLRRALAGAISAYQNVAQLALRVHDDAPGLTALAGEIFRDPRTGKIRLLESGGEEVTFFREL